MNCRNPMLDLQFPPSALCRTLTMVLHPHGTAPSQRRPLLSDRTLPQQLQPENRDPCSTYRSRQTSAPYNSPHIRSKVQRCDCDQPLSPSQQPKTCPLKSNSHASKLPRLANESHSLRKGLRLSPASDTSLWKTRLDFHFRSRMSLHPNVLLGLNE